MSPVQYAIDSLLNQSNFQDLRKSSFDLISCYREEGTLTSKQTLLAYLTIRMPATYAVVLQVLRMIDPGSILDLGAGPGTVAWAAQAAWSVNAVVTAIEREEEFISLGKQLKTPANWLQGDMLSFPSFEVHDWVIFNYSLAEIRDNKFPGLIKNAWEASRLGVVVVEPGTPRGFQRMLLARNLLLSMGGHIHAPCPHSHACPLKQPDWCHFSVRLPRSVKHRYAKEGTLSYEDEKFTFCVITRAKKENLPDRIIRPPLHRSGHVILPLCTSEGTQNLTIPRSKKDLYKKAVKANWGDDFKATASKV